MERIRQELPDELEDCTFEPKLNKSRNKTPNALSNRPFTERLTFDQTRRVDNKNMLIEQLNSEYIAKYGNGKPQINSNATKLAK